MGLSISLDEGRTACADSVVDFVRAAESFSELDLLGASRCHGWTRLDVVTHVLAGWQEMLGGMVSPVESAATVDAATYWPMFAEEFASEDAVAVLMSQRRRTAAYLRPESAVAQLRDVAAALGRGIDSFPDRRCLWQHQVFEAGDFLAIWAVENVIHHLDLHTAVPGPAGALRMARATVEALLGQPLPEDWSDVDATLIGTGRLPVPDDAPVDRSRLPVLS